MQSTKKVITTKSFEKEFNEVMHNCSLPQYTPHEPQWKSPNDFFVKFSLYPERSLSLTSTSTSLPTNQ